jgi:type IV secretion system protein VirB10
MAEQAIPQLQAEPELKRNAIDPKGVLQKHMKAIVFLGGCLLVILASVFSARKPGPQAAAKNQGPQPMLQDNTESNAADLHNQVNAERQKQQQQGGAPATAVDPALANATPAQQTVAAAYGPNGQPIPCVPGQPCPQQMGQQQISPMEQEAQQLAAKERELAYNSRFASNLVYARAPDAPAQRRTQVGAESAMAPTFQESQTANEGLASPPASNLVASRAPGDPPAPQTAAQGTQGSIKHGAEVNIDSAAGQAYVIYEGLSMDTVLMNRLDGDAIGPVKVLVSNPIYSHDHQHVLIPDGTIVLGEARKIGSNGFGQQRRLAVVFHRMIMPDGYSVDLDQFRGLDQIGEEGMKDKVNNHYLQIFGTSIALGVIAGAGEIEQGGGTITTSGSQAFTTGAAGNVSQSATTVLDRFMQIPPTITIREGHRVKVYFTQDMLLPAYENHTIPQSF